MDNNAPANRFIMQEINPDHQTDPGPGKNISATYHHSLTEFGKQEVRNDVNAAYERVKDNPTAENFSKALKDIAHHPGERSLVNGQWVDGPPLDMLQAMDIAVNAAAGPDGKISRGQLDALSNDIIGRQDYTANQVQDYTSIHGKELGGPNNLMQMMEQLMEALREFFGGHGPNIVGSANGGFNFSNLDPAMGIAPQLQQQVAAPLVSPQGPPPPKI